MRPSAARRLKIFTLLASIGLSAGAAHAGINLKSVQVSEGSQVDFLFDGPIDPSQVKTEFVREHIQLSLTNVAVYPAKVNLIQGREMTKVFAYQFAPQLVRLRVSMKMEADKYQNRLQVKANGKTLTLRVAPESAATAPAADAVKTTAAASERASDRAAAEAPKTAAANQELSAEEKKLLEPVLKKSEAKENAKEAAREAKENAREKEAVPAKAKTLASGRNPVSPFRAIGTMLLVVGLFGICAYGMKKLRADAASSKGLKGFLGKLSGNLAQKKLIQVVATMPLGPKKSISVVRIQNRMLVLGMTNESVNLITEFRADDDDAEGLANALNLNDFAAGIRDLEEPSLSAPKRAAPAPVQNVSANTIGSRAVNSYLNAKESRMPGLDPEARANAPAFQEVLKQENAKASVRAQIRSKLEGLKPL